MRLAYIVFLAFSLPLFAQMPESWPENRRLGTGFGAEGPWYGVGTWAADSHGKLGTFVNSLGLGNGVKGVGLYLEGGVHAKNWDMAAQVMAVRDPQGQSYLTLFRGHLTHTSRGGWVTGLEQEPLVWGYGLNGGYLLGEAARPFPRLRVESPMTHLQIGNAHFGTWGFQAFMGRLESDRVLSDSIQDLSYRKTILQNDPSSPFFNGYRIQARFADVMEFYVNYTNLWGGTRQGTKMTAGYNLGEYLTAMFGLKDPLAEAAVDYSDPNHPVTPYKNNARSASNFDLGGRLRLRFLEQPLGAQTVHAYISRGTKNVQWPVSTFLHKPIYYLGKDLETDGRDLLKRHVNDFWNNRERTTLPNLVVANDTAGVLIAWPEIRLGLEYSDITNGLSPWIKAFVTDTYVTGFYSHGDPLGNAIGGEAQTVTLRLDVDPSPRFTLSSWVHWGHRPFRDSPSDWQAAHPGATSANNRFFGLQENASWKMGPASTLTFGTSWQRQSASDQVEGRQANSFRWFVELGHRWVGRH